MNRIIESLLVTSLETLAIQFDEIEIKMISRLRTYQLYAAVIYCTLYIDSVDHICILCYIVSNLCARLGC